MRTAFATDGSTSLLTTQWFRMRNEVEKLAKNAGYPCFIDWFVAKFFEKQTEACGSIFFNYDYKIKYINSFSDDDVISTTLGTYTKCHGRRIEYVRTWMTEHLAFLDSYFYWRGNCSFGGAETLYLKNGSSQVNRYLVYRHRNKTTAYQYTTMMSQYNSIIELFEDAKPLAPTFLVKNKETKVYIPKNGTDTGSGTASINHVNTLVSADWNRMQVASLTKSDNLSSLYNLNSFALNLKTTSQLDQSIFYDQDEISQLKSLNLSGYSSENGQVILDISPQKIGDDEVNVFKNVTEIDIHNSKSIKSLTLSDVPLRRLNVTSSLITSLKVEN